ncbi:MAG: tRNA-specific adenosine deaminase [Phycisphaeraceae bacterium]|nr:MAG: tRNA-specific adenosine deaminase [Phycisphaeraceae bacterium]
MTPGAPESATDLDRAMMARALELADLAASEGEVPVGAVVYETATGRVLGEGRNARERDRQPWAHAEFIAVQRACDAIGDWRLNDATLCVTLEPCPMCAGLIVNARVGRVVYGAADPKAGAADTLYELLTDDRLNHRCDVIAGVQADASAEKLRAFFAGLRSGRREAD